ncbi:MAG: ATP-binding protein [Anaerolineae bacterium]
MSDTTSSAQASASAGEDTSRHGPASALGQPFDRAQDQAQDGAWRTLAEFTVPSEPGNERLAMEKVTEAVQELNLPKARLERLKTAVAEATMNAIEHGHDYQPELLVSIRLLTSGTALSVQITDQGGSQPIPEPETPDLAAKLAGQQTPRGWGLFLIDKMVDEMNVTSDETHHTVELILYLEGDENAGENG